jgi:hypothetical protein
LHPIARAGLRASFAGVGGKKELFDATQNEAKTDGASCRVFVPICLAFLGLSFSSFNHRAAFVRF